MVNVPWVWTGLVSDNFADALNWAPTLSPNSLSDAEIFLTAPTTISAGNETINSLATTAGVTLSIAADAAFTLLGAPDSVIPTGNSKISGTILLGTGAQLNLDGEFSTSGVLDGAVGSNVLVDSAFVNTGTVRQNGHFTLGDATHTGTVTNESGATWIIRSSDLDVLQVGASSPGSVFENAGSLFFSGSHGAIGVSMQNSGVIADTGGEMDFDSGISNTGEMKVSSGIMLVKQAIAGAGTLDIGASGELALAKGSDAGQTVDFLTAAVGVERLVLDQAGKFEGHIDGFARTDLIDLAHVLITSKTFSHGMLTLKDDTTTVAQLRFDGSYTASSFSFTSDGHQGTLIHVA